MIKAVATAVETAERAPGQAPVQPLYLEALTLVERLHRRLLDVIKDEFDRRGRSDINAVQALLLYNIGDSELTAGELRTRGYYLGSNVSYNVKKMVENAYLMQERSPHDRRSVRIKLSDKGLKLHKSINDSLEKQVAALSSGQISNDELLHAIEALRKLERFWTGMINYGGG